MFRVALGAVVFPLEAAQPATRSEGYGENRPALRGPVCSPRASPVSGCKRCHKNGGFVAGNLAGPGAVGGYVSASSVGRLATSHH